MWDNLLVQAASGQDRAAGARLSSRAAARLWAGAGAASIALLVGVGTLGPSAAVVPLDPGSPPLADPWLVTLMTWSAAAAGTACLAAGLLALQRGWLPSPRRLLAAGAVAAVALLAVPPLGNADIGSYAAYGRAAVLGVSPYTSTPADLPQDPIATAAEAPWEDQPSVYGPIATGVLYVAALVGQDSRSRVLRAVAALSALAFLGVGALLARRADDAARAQVLWTCNPLLLLHLVAGAHVDVFLCLFVLLAATARPGPLRTGLALGAGAAVKVTGALSMIAVVAVRPRLGLAQVAAAVTFTGALYLSVGGWEALRPVLQARSRVSSATPWRWVVSGLEQILPDPVARTATSVGVAILVLAFVSVLRRHPPGGAHVPRTMAVVWLAYLFAAGYQLAWYDSVGFVLLALLAASRWDWLLIAHTAVLSIAYLPGRVVPLPESLELATVVLRSGLCPLALLVLWAVALRGGWTRAGRDSARQ